MANDPLVDLVQVQTLISTLQADIQALKDDNAAQVIALNNQITSLTQKSNTDDALITSLKAQIVALQNTTTPPIIPPATPPSNIPVNDEVCPALLPGVTMFDWDNVGTFPKNMSWNTSGGYSNPVIPNTLGTPSFQNKVASFLGWYFNTGLNNNLSSIDNIYQRYKGKPSVHIVLDPLNPPPIGPDSKFNYRAEMAMNNSSGFGTSFAYRSEIWFSWSQFTPNIKNLYDDTPGTSGNDDQECLIHQIHSGVQGTSPHIELCTHSISGNVLIAYVNGNANFSKVPLVAGVWMDFVEHVVFSTSSTEGIYELWMKNRTTGVEVLAFSIKGATIGVTNTGGTPKLGPYHYQSWHSNDPTAANKSIANGVKFQEIYYGPLRLLYNTYGNYDANGKVKVQP